MATTPFKTSYYLDANGNYSRALDAAMARLTYDTTVVLSISLSKAVTAALTAGAQVESEVLKFLSETLDAFRLQKEFASEFESLHHEVGKAALRSLGQAYTHRRFKRSVPSYRVGDQRYAGQALYRALTSEGNIEATPFGLRFINADLLDAEARQWRRLNFGAGGGSGGGITPPQTFNVSWADVVIASLGLTADPRPAFRLPRGYWFEGEKRVGASQSSRSGRFFYAGSPDTPPGRIGRPGPSRVTRGIASANFLDRGVARIANDLPRGYLTLFDELYQRELPRIEKVAAAAKVSVPGGVGPQIISRFHRGTIYR